MVSCSFGDLAHGDSSKPFYFNTLAAGETSVNASVSVPGSGTATAWFGLDVATPSLSSIAYYTVTPTFNGETGTFTRSPAPFASEPPDSQSVVAGGAVALNITSPTVYSDNGFYIVLGTLGSLNGYTIEGTGSTFATNLYLGYGAPNSGDFFTWNADETIDGVGDTNYGLGPQSSGGTIAVNGSSSFYMIEPPCAGATYTLAQLKGGSCGMSSSTPVAVWVGITSTSDSSLSTTITSVQTQ
jgi:hypothetical protein